MSDQRQAVADAKKADTLPIDDRCRPPADLICLVEIYG